MSVADSEEPQAFDTPTFRRALGMFATGITVITARTVDGRRIGLTVNSFNSVSLDPPLIVWSLAQHLPVAPDFEACTHFAVNVLAADQLALSRRFATRDTDKFVDLEVDEGLGSAPLLRGCLATFECRNTIRHKGGDHTVFLGAVERVRHGEGHPLLYFGGRYRWLEAE
ncbi:flavin reductase family protein [Niveibacterium sp. SC-1]|uniref:flavin reductase family protein n=1 Tax=Niveibacterium sp. SC-1 TaxID=3135646 RepID=UPI00311E3895